MKRTASTKPPVPAPATDSPKVSAQRTTTGPQREEYWQHGKKHRDGGPAVTIPGWREEWFQQGRLHREDGPALQLHRPAPGRSVAYAPFGSAATANWASFPRNFEAPWNFFMYLETVLDFPMPSYGDFGAQPAVVLAEMGGAFPRGGPRWRVSDVWPCEREDLLRRLASATDGGQAGSAINVPDTDSADRERLDDGVVREESATGGAAAARSILDLLGSYDPDANSITLHSGPIFEATLHLDRQLQRPDCCGNTLATIVFLHELGHAVDFTARVGPSRASAAHRRRQAARPVLAEALAQYFAWTVITLYGTRARDVFLALDSCQPPIYRQWRHLVDGDVASGIDQIVKARQR